MQFPKRFRVLSIIFALAASSVADAAQSAFDTPWPLLGAGESARDGEVWGELDNGFRFAVIPTDAPSDAISVRLLVAAGRSNEAEGKAGVAYLASDLFFEGTENFPREDFTAFALEHGMDPRFSARTRVEIDYTVFGLDLDEARENSLPQALRFLGDVASASGADMGTFDQLRSSLKHKAGFGAGLYLPSQARKERSLLSGGKYSKIGDDRVAAEVGSVSASDVRDFWAKWYRPERMVLVISGVVEAEAAAELARETFAALQASGAPVALRSPSGKFRSTGNLDSEKSTDAYAYLSVFKTWSSPNRFDPEEEKRIYQTDFLGRLAEALSNNAKRFGQSPIDYYGDYAALNLNKRSQVLGLLEEMVNVDKAIHQLHDFVLRAEDFERAKTEYLELRHTYDPMLSERAWPGLVAERLVRCVVDELPFRYGESMGRYIEKVIRPFSFEEARTDCEELFELKKMSYVVFLPEGFDLPSKVISKRLKSMRKGYDFTWEKAGEVEQDYNINSGFQSSGIVESTELIRIEDYPALQYEFSNNLRLNLVKADPKPGRASIRLSIGNGMTSLENPNPAFAAMTRTLLLGMKIGTGLEAPTMREVLASKGLESVSAGINNAQLFWEAEGKGEEDLEEFLSATILWLITSKLEEDAFDDAKEDLEKGIDQRFGNPGAVALEESQYEKEDRMRRYYTKEELDALSYSDFDAWLKKTREEGYIEITVIGDVAPRTVLRDTRRTFGSTPVRKGKVVQPRHAKPMVWGDVGVTRETFEAKLENGYVSLIFPSGVVDSCESVLQQKVYRLLLLDYVSAQLSAYPQLQSSLDVSVLGDVMIPGSRAIRLQLLCSEEEADRALERLQEIAYQFPESIDSKMLEAAKRSVWLELKRTVRSSDQLIEFFDQSQGRPNRLNCLLGKLEKGLDGSLEDYREAAFAQFTEDTLRGIVLMPSGK